MRDANIDYCRTSLVIPYHLNIIYSIERLLRYSSIIYKLRSYKIAESRVPSYKSINMIIRVKIVLEILQN